MPQYIHTEFKVTDASLSATCLGTSTQSSRPLIHGCVQYASAHPQIKVTDASTTCFSTYLRELKVMDAKIVGQIECILLEFKVADTKVSTTCLSTSSDKSRMLMPR